MRQMKKSIIVFIGILFLGVSVSAQEFNLPIGNQYIADNPYLLSAAYAGIGDCWQARGTGFQQWVGVEDAPSTQSLSIDGRIADRSGVGLILYNDSNGFTSQKGVQASFAHHVTISEYSNQYLSFGISYKFTQFGIDSSDFNRTLNSIDGDLSTNDHNFDISALYRLGSFFISLNAINLLDSKDLSLFDAETLQEEPLSLTSYYAYTGFVFRNLIKGLEYEPSLLYRNFAFDTRSTLDLNFKLRKFFKEDYFWTGISMRGLIDQDFTPVSISPMVGITKAKFYFAYAYQINVNESIQLSTGGSHLLTVGIDFGCRKSNCGCTNEPL